MKPSLNVEDYMAEFPASVRGMMEQMRAAIKNAAPDAEEVISYGMPAYRLNGMLVFFGGFQKHIGFYPAGSGIREFADELTGYKCSKGTVKFPFDKPLPLDLIARIVKFRAAENINKLAREK